MQYSSFSHCVLSAPFLWKVMTSCISGYCLPREIFGRHLCSLFASSFILSNTREAATPSWGPPLAVLWCMRACDLTANQIYSLLDAPQAKFPRAGFLWQVKIPASLKQELAEIRNNPSNCYFKCSCFLYVVDQPHSRFHFILFWQLWELEKRFCRRFKFKRISDTKKKVSGRKTAAALLFIV